MFPGRSVGRFLLRLALIYTLLVIPWPGVHAGYVSLFQTVGNALLSSYGNVAAVSFRPPPKPQASWDTAIHVRPLGGTESWHLELSARGWAYLPTIALVSLVVASAVPIRTRCVWLVVGLGVVQLFIVVRVLIAIHYALLWGGALHATPFWRRGYELLFQSVSASPVATFVLPALVWLTFLMHRSRSGKPSKSTTQQS